MSIPLAKRILSKHLSILDSNKRNITNQWASELDRSYKIDANSLASYILDNPAFWFEASYWTPLHLKPNENFWVEYVIEPEWFDDHEIDLPATEFGLLITTSYNGEKPMDDTTLADTLETRVFYGNLLAPHYERTTLDESGKVINREYLTTEPDGEIDNHRVARDAFWGIFALTVLSSQVDGESVVVVKKNEKLGLRNLNSKNRAKRKRAHSQARMQYWEIQLPSVAENDAMIDEDINEKDTIENASKEKD